MDSYSVTFAIVLVAGLMASAQALEYEDCGSDPNRPIKFHSLAITPSPLKADAYNSAAFKISVDRDIPEFGLKMSLKKKIAFIKVPAPCINGIGSCTYENVCDVIWGEKDCPADVRAAGLPCSCPLKKGIVQSKGVKFYIPNFGKFVSALASGTYYFKAELSEKSTGKQLGCLKITLKLET